VRGLFPALLALAAFFSVSDASAFEEARRFMGTGFRIEIRDPGLAPERAAQLADGAFRRIGALERKLTSWRDDSLVGRINAAPAGTVFRLDPDTFHVLRTALDVSRRTNGAFDVTVWPLKRLWMEAKRSGELPTEYALENALRRVGWRYILLDEKTRTLTVARPGVQIDLGGIGKGYAVGRAARYLRSHGIRSALVEGGSTWERLPVGVSGEPASRIRENLERSRRCWKFRLTRPCPRPAITRITSSVPTKGSPTFLIPRQAAPSEPES